jgi:ketosteroid isomerase-like protein
MSSESLAEADVVIIRSIVESHEAQVLAGDWKAMSAAWARDIVAMPPNQSEIVGREALLAWCSSIPRVREYSLTAEEVAGCGDLAYVRMRYSMSLGSADDRSLLKDSGRGIWILLKNRDGRRLIERDIFNSERPASAGG